MECHDIRLMLTFAQRSSEHLDAEEQSALQHHLDHCPECAKLAQADLRWDQTIAQTMRAVPVPIGLQNKVLASLAASRKGWAWKRLAAGALAAALLLAIGATVWVLQGRTEVSPEIVYVYLDQGKEYTPEQVVEYFAKQGLVVDVPRKLNLRFKDLQRIDVVEFQKRRVARLSFVNADAAADILILPARQFRFNDHCEIQGFDGVSLRQESDYTYLIVVQRGILDAVLHDQF